MGSLLACPSDVVSAWFLTLKVVCVFQRLRSYSLEVSNKAMGGGNMGRKIMKWKNNCRP